MDRKAGRTIPQGKDRIGDYRGWVRLTPPHPNWQLPKPFGSVDGPIPEQKGYYSITLAAPAIDKSTADTTLQIIESGEYVRRIRYDRKILKRLIAEKGLQPEEYEFYHTTGEGEYFLSRPGYFVENASGSLVTKDRRHYTWWMDYDEARKKMALNNWREQSPEPDLEDSEYQDALKRLEGRAKRATLIA